jgi:hypothetical protein
MEIMRYRYGRMGRGEGRTETKGIEDGRKTLAKEKLSYGKGTGKWKKWNHLHM